jgi:hypothetical protein
MNWVVSVLKFSCKSAVLALMLASAHSAYAGGDISGGGAGVKAGAIAKKLYLLDFYERKIHKTARVSTVYNMRFEDGEDREKILALCGRLDLKPDGDECTGLRAKQAEIRRYVPELAGLVGTALGELQFKLVDQMPQETNDDGLLALDEKEVKRKVRIARRFVTPDGTTEVDIYSGTWNGNSEWHQGQLTTTSKIGLITHELVYYLDAKLNGATTSEKARNANAALYASAGTLGFEDSLQGFEYVDRQITGKASQISHGLIPMEIKALVIDSLTVGWNRPFMLKHAFQATLSDSFDSWFGCHRADVAGMPAGRLDFDAFYSALMAELRNRGFVVNVDANRSGINECSDMLFSDFVELINENQIPI